MELALAHEQAKELTGCRHGYVSEIEPLSGDNLVHTFTSMLAQCKVREKRVRFPRGADGRYPGLWGHALNTRKGFYTNTPGEHPQARGTPEGHVALENFLSAPAKADGRLMGQIALANTPEAFEPWHLDVVEKLAQLYAIAIEYLQKVEQVRSAERRLREIVENQVDGMLVLDQGGRIRFANRATELMLGRQRESLIDHDFGFPIAACEATELQLLQRGGRMAVCETRAAPTEWEGEAAYVVNLHDITERIESAREMEQMLEETIRVIAAAVEKRDPYTAGHQRRVSELATAIAEEMELEREQVRGIRLGALIHDLGKIYTPAEILSRPGTLSDAEFELIKSHCQVGYDIVKAVRFPWPIARWCCSTMSGSTAVATHGGFGGRR